ncbi:hypothetical protein NUW46_13400 [Marinobacter sp. MA]|uniref:hypothetical protein n=1 Tax=Marinobacter sp. MA TaxID=2971606 RepID=UPI003AABAF61
MNKPHVIGEGLIAKAFADSWFDDEVVIFASGVSRSSETRQSEFSRERELLNKALRKFQGSIFIYFSSTNVVLGRDSEYTKHKRNMEDLVKSCGCSFYIFQLPQVVGVVNNNTLVSYLVRSLFAQSTLDVQINAKRNLIGVEDLVRVVTEVVNSGRSANTVQIIASACNVSVVKIVEEIGAIMGLSPVFRMEERGDDQSVSIEFLESFLAPDDPLLQPNYWRNVLRYYVPRLMSRFCE